MYQEETFIKLFRKITEWQWYTDNNTKCLFIHCLIRANFKDRTVNDIKVKRGEFITSISKLSHETGLSTAQVRHSLDKLRKSKNITSRTTNKYTVINVVNYNDYNGYENNNSNQNSKQIANKQQTNNKQIATDNKDNKVNKEKNNTQYITKGQSSSEIMELLDKAYGKENDE